MIDKKIPLLQTEVLQKGKKFINKSSTSINYFDDFVKFNQNYLYQPDSNFLQSYANEKKLPVDFLLQNGVNQPSPNRLNFPYYDENNHFLFNRRRYQKSAYKMLWDKDTTVRPYGLWRLKDYTSDYIVLAEGETDSLTCWHNNIQAIGIPGCNTFQESWVTLLNRFEKVYFPVEDKAGYKASERLLQFIPNLILVGHKGYLDSKLDINNLYQLGIDLHDFFDTSNQIESPFINTSLSPFRTLYYTPLLKDTEDTIKDTIIIEYTAKGYWDGIVRKELSRMALITKGERETTFGDIAERFIFYGTLLVRDYESPLDELIQIGLDLGLKSSWMRGCIKNKTKRVESGQSGLHPTELDGYALTRTWDTYSPTKQHEILLKKSVIAFSWFMNHINRDDSSYGILLEEWQNGFLSSTRGQTDLSQELGIGVRTLSRWIHNWVKAGYCQRVITHINNKKYWCFRFGYIEDGQEIYFIDSPCEVVDFVELEIKKFINKSTGGIKNA